MYAMSTRMPRASSSRFLLSICVRTPCSLIFQAMSCAVTTLDSVVAAPVMEVSTAVTACSKTPGLGGNSREFSTANDERLWIGGRFQRGDIVFELLLCRATRNRLGRR